MGASNTCVVVELRGKDSQNSRRGKAGLPDLEECKSLVIEKRVRLDGDDCEVIDGDGQTAPQGETVLAELSTPYDYHVFLRGGTVVSLGEIGSDLFQGLCRKHLLKPADFEATGCAKEVLAKVFLDLVEAGEALKGTTLAGKGVRIAGRTVRLTLDDWRGVRLGGIELEPELRAKVDPLVGRYPVGETEKYLAPEKAATKKRVKVRSTRGV
jgi:hypothetical protein